METLLNDVFTEIAVLLALAAVVGAIGLRLKQPLIVAFIAVGILVGPSVFGWVEVNDQVDLLARLGIALLLFLVGLKLDLNIIKTMGPVALSAGLGQVLFTSVFGFLIALALGLNSIHALYVAVALTFSSTIIIVKLLSDKRELDQLHGRIAIGFLIVQDIVVVLVMIALTAIGETSGGGLGERALAVLINGAISLLFVAVSVRYLLTPLMDQLAKSSEMLVLFAVAWAVALAAAGVHLGFSKEVGAFLAGVSVASTPYREVIGARLVSLRDFLLLFFFIDLGVGLDMSTLGGQVLPAIILSAFVLIGNPLIVLTILSLMGYRKRTGFMAGLTVAQISEFSLILAALGVSQGHINSQTMGLITLVGLITISLSTYMILYAERLYQRLEPWLTRFERKIPHRELAQPDDDKTTGYDVIVFGLGRMGAMLADEFSRSGHRVLAFDVDPQRVAAQKNATFSAYYGDMEAPEFVSHLPLGNVKWVVSSVRLVPENIAMLYALNEADYRGKTAAFADSERDKKMLEDKGINKVMMLHAAVAREAIDDVFSSS